MPIKYELWPHLDVARMPVFVSKFLMFTIVVSMYVGTIFLIVLSGIAVTAVMASLFGSTGPELSEMAALVSQLR